MRERQQRASFYARDASASGSSASICLLRTSRPKTGFGLTLGSELNLGVDKGCSSHRCRLAVGLPVGQQEVGRTSGFGTGAALVEAYI
ncbi:hypothetical protein [Paenibacillus peoriae]|uniref:hypothetical protein n=1 Tax=Paenibacillus peoriae TaxID=59893 RepID=UPI00215AB8DA|nr:hypothetical protein [Paenibacillus peoriae]